MIIAGITGGIGSGKTAVCKLLEKRGAGVFYADEIARQLMSSNVELRGKIIAAFGAASYHEDGSLNRAHLSKLIFHSDKDRFRMNALVHPVVGKKFEDFVSRARSGGVSLIVKEAALLFEAGTDNLDMVIVVDAPEEARIERVMSRDGLTRSQIEARMAGQMAPGEMCERADYVIDNSGDKKTLENQVIRLMEMLH